MLDVGDLVMMIFKSKMATKKRKVDFLANAILSEIDQGVELLQCIKEFESYVSISKIPEVLRTFQKNVEFDIVGLLALMCGFEVVIWTMFAMKHVPRVFDRYKKTRCGIIFSIINFLCPKNKSQWR